MKHKILTLLILVSGMAHAQDSNPDAPTEYVYKIIGADSLKAYVFTPSLYKTNSDQPSIVIFHGGEWAMGEASWGFGYGERFAKLGLVSIVVQYRLSDEKNTTPIDAMADARVVMLWTRENAEELRIAKDRIAAYGWSAGAHLSASAAVFPSYNADNSLSSIPNALILHSPALSLVKDGWFKKLLMDKGDPVTYSPAENIKGSMPPSIIVVGNQDTVTPVEESELFHRNMLKYNNTSYLFKYDGVGHLFTPADQPDNRWPNPDKEVTAKAFDEIDSFLRKLKFID